MAEYTADELADDSEDEKRLEKAERVAERKAQKRKRARADASLRRPRFSNASNTVTSGGVGGGPSVVQPAMQGPKRLQVPVHASRPVGPCFACGEMGHLRHRCPRTASLPEKKQYPAHLKCSSVKAPIGTGNRIYEIRVGAET